MASDSDVLRDTYAAYCYARDAGHLDFVKKAQQCDEYFEGLQWDAETLRRLAARRKPVVTANKTLSSMAAVFGEQLANRADVSFRPAKQGTSETAAALDKVWLHISNSNNLDWIESEVAADGFIRSRGFYDVRVEFDDHWQGEVRVSLLNSKNVVIDPDAEEYDPDKWKEVFVTKWFSENDIVTQYGDAAAKEIVGRGVSRGFSYDYDTLDWLPDNFGSKNFVTSYDSSFDHATRRIYRIIERQFKEVRWREHFVNPQTGDMRPVPETWSRDRIAWVMQQYGLVIVRRRGEQIRWSVICGDTKLHYDWSPYKHFTPVPYFPFFRHGRTIGLVENQISLQDLLNKSLSQEMHIVNTTSNSGWISKPGNLANMTTQDLEERGGEDGIVIEAFDTNQLVKIQPNQVPSGLDRVSFKADESLKEVSMVSDSMRGFDRADVAAKAIKAKQSRGVISLAKPFENLAQTRKILARNVLDLVQEFYTETRVLNITGNDLGAESEELQINAPQADGSVLNDLTIGEYSVVVSTVPARENYEQSQFQEALELRQLGVQIPDDVLIENSHLRRKNEIAKRIKDATGGDSNEAQQQAQQMQMQMAQLEMKKAEAEAEHKMAKAESERIKAQIEMAKFQSGGEAAQEEQKMLLERAKAAQQMELERESALRKLEMEQMKVQSELRTGSLKSAFEIDRKNRESTVKNALALHTAKVKEKNSAASRKST